MEVDFTQKHVLTACQDRNIRVYSVNSGKHTKTFKGSVGEDGSLIKVLFKIFKTFFQLTFIKLFKIRFTSQNYWGLFIL